MSDSGIGLNCKNPEWPFQTVEEQNVTAGALNHCVILSQRRRICAQIEKPLLALNREDPEDTILQAMHLLTILMATCPYKIL